LTRRNVVAGGSTVPLVTRENTRRVFVLGVAGLVPAALLTLLLLQQPAIGHRRLYPLLRVPLAAIAFTLALVTVIAWARSSKRLSRPALSGLAWAAVAVLLCIGPFVESNPRDRLFALELDDGDVAWRTSGAGRHPRLIAGVVIVEEEDSDTRVCLDPADEGHQLGREDDLDSLDRRCDVALAADARSTDDAGYEVEVVDGHLEADGGSWTQSFAGEEVLAVEEAGDGVYAYVATPRAATTQPDDPPVGAIVKLAVADGRFVWRSALDESVASDEPALDAIADSVVVAGGESITALDGTDGHQRWIESVAALGKSRGYALPQAVHEVVIDDENDLVLLSVTPAA
jgi:hypothetical protein